MNKKLQENSGKLFIVSTPIGNLGDVSSRAAAILREVDVVACEDTRVTNKLLQHLGIKKKMICYSDHSNQSTRKKIIDLLLTGNSVALVSDAGTPLISDPGYKLVRQLSEESINVSVIPGPCAAIAALTISGLPTDKFYFLGFLAQKTNDRQKEISDCKNLNSTLVIYEPARRIHKSLLEIYDILGDREVSVVREITKLYEEVNRSTLQEAVKFYKDLKVKGEVVIIIGPPSIIESIEEIDKELAILLKESSVRDAVKIIASNSSLSKKDIYKRAIELKE